MGMDQRHFKRILAQRFGGCYVKLQTPEISEAILVDISVGGMKILIEKELPETVVAKGTAASGEIGSQNPAFRMSFSATIAWQRNSALDGTMTTALGLQFADYTPLPDALMNLVENYEAI
jgi:c-di-GMP-binding flagellar brake protein YcgR